MTDETRVWRRRAFNGLLVVVIVAAFFYWRRPRSPDLPLDTVVDGPPPASATGVLVFLHGRGVAIERERAFVDRLRRAGLPATVSIVLLEGPYVAGLGHGWGDYADDQESSRARIRARLDDLLADAGPPPSKITIAGFSQGAGVALDVAVQDKRIGGVASFSPCRSILRGELPMRDDLRVLLVHGSRDSRCPVEESRSLARVLEEAHRPVKYIELDAEHAIPQEAIRALVTFATPSP